MVPNGEDLVAESWYDSSSEDSDQEPDADEQLLALKRQKLMLQIELMEREKHLMSLKIFQMELALNRPPSKYTSNLFGETVNSGVDQTKPNVDETKPNVDGDTVPN